VEPFTNLRPTGSAAAYLAFFTLAPLHNRVSSDRNAEVDAVTGAPGRPAVSLSPNYGRQAIPPCNPPRNLPENRLGVLSVVRIRD